MGKSEEAVTDCSSILEILELLLDLPVGLGGSDGVKIAKDLGKLKIYVNVSYYHAKVMTLISQSYASGAQILAGCIMLERQLDQAGF